MDFFDEESDRRILKRYKPSDLKIRISLYYILTNYIWGITN